jgi:tetratricopeptide (TPR) repeat protein
MAFGRKKTKAMLFFLLGSSTASAQVTSPEQLFKDAQQAQQRGDLPLAVGKYQEVIKLDPNVVAAHANLGVVLVSLGRFDEAITQYHIALAEAPDNPALRLNLGLAHYKKGDFAGAAAQFASLREENPSDIRIATLLGNCQMQLGLIAQAIAVLEPLEKANPDNLDLEWAMGMALVRAGRTWESLPRIQKVADREQNAEAYQIAANLSSSFAFFDQARRDAEAAIRLNPNAANAYVVLAWSALMQNDAARALPYAEKAEQKEPTLSTAQLVLGRALVGIGRVKDGTRYLEKAKQLDPGNVEVHIALAEAYSEAGRKEDAWRERMESLHPASTEAAPPANP